MLWPLGRPRVRVWGLLAQSIGLRSVAVSRQLSKCRKAAALTRKAKTEKWILSERLRSSLTHARVSHNSARRLAVGFRPGCVQLVFAQRQSGPARVAFLVA